MYWTEPQASDLSGRVTLVSQTHLSGDFFMEGGTEVNYTFIDGSENAASCRFYVTLTSGEYFASTWIVIGIKHSSPFCSSSDCFTKCRGEHSFSIYLVTSPYKSIPINNIRNRTLSLIVYCRNKSKTVGHSFTQFPTSFPFIHKTHEHDEGTLK